MPLDPDIHHRRTLRLPGYDYAMARGYFVTLCAARGRCLFGEVADDAVQLNAAGHIVRDAWNDLPAHYPHVALDAFVIMPNHVHGIIALRADQMTAGADHLGTGIRPGPTEPHIPQSTVRRHGLPEIVRAFKSFSAQRINKLYGGGSETRPYLTGPHDNVARPAQPVWQRNYYEHIIRDETDADRIREYIVSNPIRWAADGENPAKNKR